MDKFIFFSWCKIIFSSVITIILSFIVIINNIDLYNSYFQLGAAKTIGIIFGLTLGIAISFAIIYLIVSALVYAIYLLKKRSYIEGSIIIGSFSMVFLYIYLILIQNDIFNSMIPIENQPSYPTFMEYVGIIAAITIPFLLLMFTNNANDSREEYRLQKLYESFYQCIILDQGPIIDHGPKGTRQKLDDLANKRNYNTILLVHNFNSKKTVQHHTHYYGMNFRNVGNHLETIDLETINCKFKNQEYITDNSYIDKKIIVPSKECFDIVLDLHGRLQSQMEFEITFLSTNNIGISYEHTFTIEEESRFTNYSKKIV